MDEAKLQAFMGKLVTDMGGAAIMANVMLGDELGLYRAMADGQALTPEELAGRTGCHPRLVREWLNGQAASGYVEHAAGRFRLPEEQAMALAQEDSPVYVAGGAAVLASMFIDKDKIAAAMRGDGSLSWGDHHPCLFYGTERFFRPGYRAPSRQQLAAGAAGRGGQARAGRQGRRHRLRPRRLDHRHGAGLPEVALPRLRLPSAVDRAGAGRAAAAGIACRSVRHRRQRRTSRARATISSASSTACTTWATRSAPRGTSHEAGAGRQRAAGRAFRQRQLDDNLNPVGRCSTRRRPDLHAELAVAGGGPGARRAGRRGDGCATSSPRPASVASAAPPRHPFNLVLEATH